MFKTLIVACLAAGSGFASAAKPWHIDGTLSEVCSCGIPCTCNFGQAPDKSYCYAIIGMTIDHGSYGALKLDGLRIAGAQGSKGFAFFLDSRANAAQLAALTEIAHEMWWKGVVANGVKSVKEIPEGYAWLGVKAAKLTHVVTKKGNSFTIEGAGGFSTDFLMGFDGKTPIVVEHNTTFNIARTTKGKSKKASYADSYGNQFKFEGTNGNHGHFVWTDKTPAYFK